MIRSMVSECTADEGGMNRIFGAQIRHGFKILWNKFMFVIFHFAHGITLQCQSHQVPDVRRSGFWPWFMVLLVLVFSGLFVFACWTCRWTRDEGEYAYAGQLILQGRPAYKLAYNMKLPGTYFADALGMAVFGQTIAGVHLTLPAGEQPDDRLCVFVGKKIIRQRGRAWWHVQVTQSWR